MKKSILVRSLRAIALAGLTLGAIQVRAQMVNLYVGIDSRENLTSGTYAGLANPNASRLTLLHAHTYPYGQFQNNHYHSIGAYSYTGPAGSPTANDTSAGNAIPEVYTQLPGNTLVHGTNGVWLGKRVSRKTRERYSDLRMRSVHSLASFGAGGRTPIPPARRFVLKFHAPATPVLAAAPEASGPWEVIPFPPAPDTTYTQTGTSSTGTFPLTAGRQFYQLRQVTLPAPN